MKYRIETQKLHNGTIRHVAQVYLTSPIRSATNLYSLPCWVNLVKDEETSTIKVDGLYETHYDNEQDAMRDIEAHRIQYADEIAFDIKSVSHKEV
jgi:hypothetical protein